MTDPAQKPVAERITLLSVAGRCIGAIGHRIQPLPAHVRRASRMLCVMNLVVAAVSIRDQDAAETIKEGLCPFSAAAPGIQSSAAGCPRV